VPFWASVLAAGVAAAAGFDLARRRVPNALNLALCAAGLAARAATGGAPSLATGLAGTVLGMALLLAPFAAGWLGGGDVKLLGAIGAWLGTDVLWAGLGGLAGGGLLAAAVALRGGAPLRADVWANLRLAALTLRAPDVPRRGPDAVVPMAVAFAGAALGVFFARGGLA
jgi:prepilin peptidase CpaA